MKPSLNKIIGNLAVITICALLLSAAYVDGYYIVFGIDIYSFITHSELLFKLNGVFVITMFGLFFLFNMLVGARLFLRDRFFSNQYLWIRKLILFMAFAFICLMVGFVIVRTGLKTSANVVYLGFLLFSGYAAYFIFNKGEQARLKAHFDIIIIMIFASILVFASIKGSLDAKNVLLHKPKRTYSFGYAGKDYKTNDGNLVFLGQTYSTIFIYSRTDSSTWMIPRDDVDYFKVHVIRQTQKKAKPK